VHFCFHGLWDFVVSPREHRGLIVAAKLRLFRFPTGSGGCRERKHSHARTNMRPRKAKSPAPQRRASSPALQRTGSSSTVPPEGNLGSSTVVRVLPQSAIAAATAAATGCCACGHLLAWLRVHVPLTRASITNFDRAGETRSRRRIRQGGEEARLLRMDVLDLRVFGGGRLCCRSCSHPS